jgi:hypothetical protein
MDAAAGQKQNQKNRDISLLCAQKQRRSDAARDKRGRIFCNLPPTVTRLMTNRQCNTDLHRARTQKNLALIA